MPPKYKSGDRVRVLNQIRWGHIRTPLFVLGKTGIVETCRGEFPDPEKTRLRTGRSAPCALLLH